MFKRFLLNLPQNVAFQHWMEQLPKALGKVALQQFVRQFVDSINKKDSLLEKGKAEENAYFLKKQTEQLMKLRHNLIKEKDVNNQNLNDVTYEVNRLRDDKNPAIVEEMTVKSTKRFGEKAESATEEKDS